MIGPVFITGGSGLLALNWAMAVQGRARVVLALHDRRVALDGVEARHVDLTRVDAIARALDGVEPGLVVHAAGLTSVEVCEADPARARHANVDLAANVAAACTARGVRLVHISTDHLFRGDQALVTESHPVDPQNVYGRTKADAEVRVLDACPRALVVRTNFFGWGPAYRRSFSDRVIDALRTGARINLFTDVFHTPILASALSAAVYELSERGVSGIVHLVGDERISKHALGLRIAETFGLDAGLIDTGRLADEPALVRRPFDMSLRNDHARRLLGRPLGDVRAHLTTLRDEEAARQVEKPKYL